MRISSCIAAAAVFAGSGLLAIGLVAAAPLARAVDDAKMNGVYAYADEDGETGTWTISTTCRQICIADVTTGPGQGFSAPLIDGRYTVTRTVPEGAVCLNDHSQHPVTITQSWDAATLSGVVFFLDTSAPCGLDDTRDDFTLTKIG